MVIVLQIVVLAVRIAAQQIVEIIVIIIAELYVAQIVLVLVLADVLVDAVEVAKVAVVMIVLLDVENLAQNIAEIAVIQIVETFALIIVLMAVQGQQKLQLVLAEQDTVMFAGKIVMQTAILYVRVAVLIAAIVGKILVLETA